MRCGLCFQKAERFLKDVGGVDFYYCSSCDFVFKDPVSFWSMEDQKSRYDLHENDPEDEGYRAYFKRFLDFVTPYMPKSGSVLDFGCGRSTLLADMLREKGFSADAYDPIYHPEIPYHSKKYDIVVSTEVFEHLHDPISVFETLLGVLSEEGVLALQTQFFPAEVSEFARWYYHKDPTHIVFFRAETFSHLARRYDCELLAHNGKNMVVLRKKKRKREVCSD